ncbi:MAG: RluA family pseudouridine synthase [Ruthenibacterium sp.]
MTTLEFTVDESGTRIDLFLAQREGGIARSLAQRLLADGAVLCNGRSVAKSYRVAAGDIVRVLLPEPQDIAAKPQDIPLVIVYEDAHLLVVNKPKGMVVHPAPGNPEGTLVNALLYHCKGSLSGINGKLRPGIVHRIDKDTSGLLVVAKDNDTHVGLTEQFALHSITRQYQAVVYGAFAQDSGFVEAPIGRHPVERKRMAVTEKNSKYAYTTYAVLTRYSGFTHVALTLKTGRTHQIRVHMASIGHPLAGDAVYGPKKCITSLNGQCLHAKTLGFVHPVTGEAMEFSSELPPYFTEFLRVL